MHRVFAVAGSPPEGRPQDIIARGSLVKKRPKPTKSLETSFKFNCAWEGLGGGLQRKSAPHRDALRLIA
eukprot:237880-Amphidinium_carterae.1